MIRLFFNPGLALIGFRRTPPWFIRCDKIYVSSISQVHFPLQSRNNSKFKSRMCRNHARGGCSKGHHCTFAHSEEELK